MRATTWRRDRPFCAWTPRRPEPTSTSFVTSFMRLWLRTLGSAELNGSPSVEFPQELTSLSNDVIAAKAMEDQLSQFNERRSSLDGQISILRSRGDQLRQEIDGLDRQRSANEEQINFIIDELRDVRGLYEKSLVSKTRWLALERERARLSGDIGRAIAERAKAEKSIGETELQIQQAKQQFQEQASHDLVEIPRKAARPTQQICGGKRRLPSSGCRRSGHRARAEFEGIYDRRRLERAKRC